MDNKKILPLKNTDVYKMHTYKDAILSTQGSYILSPGDENAMFRVEDNQPIPSVDAFPLTLGKDGMEEEELEKSILAILKTIIN